MTFTPTWDEPLFSQLGDPETKESREESLACMKILPMLGFWDHVPPLASGVPWNLIEHQTAGVCCHHPRMIGTSVRLKNGVHSACLEIAREWFGSDLGRDGVRLDEATAYRRQLNAIGLDCKYSWTYSRLEEGFYPAEIDQIAADRILDQHVVLSDLLAEPTYMRKIGFFFIAGNSD